MNSFYRFIISRKGNYVFNTDLDCHIDKAKQMYKMFSSAFPKRQGYRVSVAFWETSGQDVHF